MTTRYIFIFACVFSLQGAASDDPLASLKKGQTKDVVELIDRLSGCNHWSGEEPYDADRKKQISFAMAKLKCGRLAKDEAAALKRYAKKPNTINVLRQAKEF